MRARTSPAPPGSTAKEPTSATTGASDGTLVRISGLASSLQVKYRQSSRQPAGTNLGRQQSRRIPSETTSTTNGLEHGMMISGGKVKNIDDPEGHHYHLLWHQLDQRRLVGVIHRYLRQSARVRIHRRKIQGHTGSQGRGFQCRLRNQRRRQYLWACTASPPGPLSGLSSPAANTKL